MTLRYIIWLSTKNLWRRKLRTVLTSGAVTIGVGAVVFLLSTGIGLQQLIIDQIATLDNLYNINVTDAGSKIISLDTDTIQQVEALSNVASVEPVLNVAAKISYEKSVTDGVVYGVSDQYFSFSGLEPNIGKNFSGTETNQIVVNYSALNLLGLEAKQDTLGKTISLEFVLNSDAFTNPSDAATAEYTIIGIIDNEKTPVVYAPINSLAVYQPHKYDLLVVRADTNNENRINELRQAIENMGLKTNYIGDTISQINQVFRTFKAALMGFGLIALVIAVLGMLNTLTVTLLEKTREVGFMKAIGVRERDIMRLFIVENLLISFVGGVVGIILAYLSGNGLNLLINIYATRHGSQPVSFFATPWYLVVGMLAVVAVVGALTAYLPARRGARINPLDALRYE